MADEEALTTRPSISSVDARIGRLESGYSRLEARQVEQDGVMRLIQLEQQHIREIMNSRFSSLESHLDKTSAKLDTFMGRIESLIERGLKDQADLEATPLGRVIDSRLIKVEAWKETSTNFYNELKGMGRLIRILVGGSVIGAAVSIIAILKAFGAF